MTLMLTPQQKKRITELARQGRPLRLIARDLGVRQEDVRLALGRRPRRNRNTMTNEQNQMRDHIQELLQDGCDPGVIRANFGENAL